MWQLWLISAGLFFVLEIATTGFLVFWFGIGCLFAMVTSFFTDNVFIQSTVFVISSTCLLFFTRKFVNKFANNKEKINTNAFSVLGKTGIVTEEINAANGTGQVKIEGEIWTAKADQVIPEGSSIDVLKIDGVKVMVAPHQKESTIK
ncbi:MAG: NfeD family protein [Clostridia bacterium]